MTVVPASDVLHYRRASVQPVAGSVLPSGDITFTVNGRSALALGLVAMGVAPGKRVLVPDFICRSVVNTLTYVGAVPSFYRVDRELRPDLDDFERKLRDVHSAVAVHYLGWRLADFDQILSSAAARDTPVIEDCAHGLFAKHQGSPLGSEGSAAVFSFRKSIALPLGGALVLPGTSTHITRPPRFQPSELTGLVREIVFRAERLIGIPIKTRLLSKQHILDRLYDRDDALMPNPTRPMGLLSASILRRQPPEEPETRRRNFRRLAEMLGHGPGGISILLDEAPVGACPIGFPILVPDRNRVRARLYEKGIGTRTFWDRLPQELHTTGHDDAHVLSAHLLALPVHSGLRSSDLEHIHRTLSE